MSYNNWDQSDSEYYGSEDYWDDNDLLEEYDDEYDDDYDEVDDYSMYDGWTESDYYEDE